jgi:hypothetical protein
VIRPPRGVVVRFRQSNPASQRVGLLCLEGLLLRQLPPCGPSSGSSPACNLVVLLPAAPTGALPPTRGPHWLDPFRRGVHRALTPFREREQASWRGGQRLAA